MYPQQNTPAPDDQNQYDFIVNPGKSGPRNGGQPSMILRLGLVLGLILIVLVGFIGIKSLLIGGESTTDNLYKILGQQQQMIVITSAATTGKTAPLSVANAAAATTTELSLITARQELAIYTSGGGKINPKKTVYAGRVAVNEQLAASITAGTYNATFASVLETQLTEYQQTLRTTFNMTKNNEGRKLLGEQYDQATLLLKQLDTNN